MLDYILGRVLLLWIRRTLQSDGQQGNDNAQSSEEIWELWQSSEEIWERLTCIRTIIWLGF